MGRVHSEASGDGEECESPDGSTLWQDAESQGFAPKGVTNLTIEEETSTSVAQ